MKDRMISHRYPVRLKITAIIVVALSMAVPSLATQTKPQAIPSSVEMQLDAHVKRYIDWYEAEYCTDRDPDDTGTCRGTEYKKARRFCFGDLDGDGKEDIAALYTLESFCCGNSYQFYLAVFLKSGAGFKLAASEKVGGKGERGVDFNAIKGARILLKTDEYLPGDPMCCPSGKGSTTYTLKNGKLVESDRVGQKPMSQFYQRNKLVHISRRNKSSGLETLLEGPVASLCCSWRRS